MSVITFVTDRAPAVDPNGAVGLLCQVAPDGILARRFPQAVRLRELFGDYQATKRRAYLLAQRLLRDEPPLRGIRQLGALQDLLIGHLEFALHVVHLTDWLTANGVTTCVFTQPSPVADCLSTPSAQSGVRVSIPARHRSPLFRRLHRIYGRLKDGRFSRQAIDYEWRELLEHLDPYRRRRLLWPRPRRQRAHGGIWFYSSAYTFSQIGLAYEPYFPRRFDFLIEDPLTGGRALDARSRPSVSIYEFSSPRVAPSRAEIEAGADAIARHLRSVSLPAAEARARDIVLSSWIEREFRRRLLPLGLYHTGLFEEWAAQCRPDALVVGNPVFEAFALIAARKRGVPTILLQHGILGDYCQFTDPPADHYIVRGKFWQDFLAPEARQRSRILNIPQQSAAPAMQRTERKSILFLTAPASAEKFWSESDAGDILDVLLKCAAAKSVELIVRVHPSEDVGYYRRRIDRLASGGSGRVAYSQGGSLDDVLARSAVAVTYCSTAFLDCLRWRVPIVSFGWHDFSYKEQIRQHGVFNFADGLGELESLVSRALAGELPPFRAGVEPFFASTSPADLTREIAAMLGAKPAAGRPQPRQNLALAAAPDG